MWPALVALAVIAGASSFVSLHPGSRDAQAAVHVRISSSRPHAATARARGATGQAHAAARRPNIVFVLTDDLSMDLVRFMPEVQALENRGMRFDDYFVSDSLCCPSRASIFTGDFPHDSGVFTNAGDDGGIGAFFAHGDENRSFNVALQRDGYRTALMGKYLNGYLAGPSRSPVPGTYVPTGWNEWDVAGWGYPEFNYVLNQDGRLHHYGHRPKDYLTDVIAQKGVNFIKHSAAAGKPFFLELASFAPHNPYTPAPRYAHSFPGLKAPRPASFNRLPANAPAWLAGHPPLTSRQVGRINQVFRKRVQAVQAVDDLLAKVETVLQARGLAQNTYVVFSSDNGFHTGEYRLTPGKLTAFDTDIHVPLVVAGPGVPAGSKTTAMAENIDLAKTFTAVGQTTMADDGHSLLPLLRGTDPADWRNAILVEHHGPDLTAEGPDMQSTASGNPTSYEAMRTPNYLYVEYRDGEREFYDLRSDPDELYNLVPNLTSGELTRLHQELGGLENCHNGTACWSAAHVAPNP